MIINNQKENDVLSYGEENKTIEMSIALDQESQAFLMSTLSENLYSDVIGSPIREYCSNALDSHREANVTEPILVKFGLNENGNYEFSVQDFGTGLDDEDVTNILSKYGASTKRQNAKALGMYGLGMKSGLAYTKSSFIFIARKNGIERKYMMYNSESGKSIDLLHECATTERNGVKVIIPVKREDRYAFISAIKEQLAYFEHVYFDGIDGIFNDFKIYRNELFQISELNDYGEMHICLDNIYYPIDWKALEIPIIGVNLGLRFSLVDGIFPTPNREAIKMTKETKALILDKINKIADYLISQYNENNNAELFTYNDVIDYFNNSEKYFVLNGHNIPLSPFAKYSKFKLNKPFIKGIDKIDLYSHVYLNRNNSFDNYERSLNYKHKRIFSLGRWDSSSIDTPDTDKYTYILCPNKPSIKMREYIEHIINTELKSIKLIRKVYNIRLFPPNYGHDKISYYSLLHLNNYPKSEWRERIMEYQSLISPFTDKFISLKSNDDIPKEWLEERKKQKAITILSNGTTKERRKKLSGEFSAKIGENLEKYTGNNCKFISETFQLNDFHTRKCLYVYGKESDKNILDGMYAIFSKQRIKFLLLSDREYNNVSKTKIHNLMSITEFKDQNSAPFRRVITAYLIQKLRAFFPNSFTYSYLFKETNINVSNKLNKLDDYVNTNLKISNVSNSIMKDFMPMAEDNALFDWNIYPDYLEIKSYLERYEFIEFLITKLVQLPSYRSFSEEDKTKMMICITDLIKYNTLKPKINEMLTLKNVKETAINAVKELELTEEKINILEEQI